MAHFPFAEHWVAGHVRGTTGAFLAGNTSSVTVTKLLDPPGPVVFGNAHFKLSIAGVNSVKDGQLYAQGTMNAGSGNVVPVGILPDGSG